MIRVWNAGDNVLIHSTQPPEPHVAKKFHDAAKVCPYRYMELIAILEKDNDFLCVFVC